MLLRLGIGLTLVCSFAAAEARADGRYCERTSPTCWDCADITFPAAVPCSAPMSCAAGELCVDQSGVPTCFPPTPYCCETAPCTIPPGCEGAASSCGTGGPGRDSCTFLSDCPAAMDAGTMDVDGGVDAGTMDLDAGTPTVDAGTVVDDAGADAGEEPLVDAGPPPPDDDAGPAPRDAGSTSPPEDDGGCGCRTTSPAGTTPLIVVWLLFAAITRLRRTSGR